VTEIPKPSKRAPKPRKRIRTRKTIGHKRREAKAAGSIDADSWQAVLAFYSYGCAYCPADHWDHQDHVVPLSKGGIHGIENVVPSCAKCNYAKGTHVRLPKRRHPFMARL
jgi:5-methylcytosine-specific restriction endonuclease McrA